jgi:hypothetical protein
VESSRDGAHLLESGFFQAGLGAAAALIRQWRTTKDVDLRLVGSADKVLAQLQQAGRRDLGDFMTFEVGPDEELSNPGRT